MNELVQELAEHCDFYIGNEHSDKSHEEKQRLFMERFAELIVRECAELTLDYKSETYYNGWLDYRDEIKRHFGVEE